MSAPAWLDFEALAADYARYHRTRGNRLCHLVGIPLIVFCIVRWTQPPGSFFPLAAVVLPLYVLWNPRLGLLMAAIIFLMAAAAYGAGLKLTAALFAVGWFFQLLGHKAFEKKSPAFTRNLLHLLVGPLWILRELGALKNSPSPTEI